MDEKTTGYVYFIGNFDSGFVKIGMTNADNGVLDRMKSIQTGCPFDLSLLATIKCTIVSPYRVEKDLHRAFSLFRKAGEWFALTKAMKVCLESIGVALEESNKRVVEVLPASYGAWAKKGLNADCSWRTSNSDQDSAIRRLCKDSVKSNPCRGLVACLSDALDSAYRYIDQMEDEIEVIKEGLNQTQEMSKDWTGRSPRREKYYQLRLSCESKMAGSRGV